MPKKQIIFNISGGVGKNIMATAVVSALKEAHPDRSIIITSPYSFVWQNNPNVQEVVNIEKTASFYRDYLKDTDTLIFRHDPYHTEDFVYQRKHLIEIWSELCKAQTRKPLRPELFFTEEEIGKIKKRLFHDPKDKRPIFMIQTSGGYITQTYPISWARDLPFPIALKIVAQMNKKGFRTIHIRRKDQRSLPNTEYLELSLREMMGAIQFSKARLFIDSFAEHTAAAFNLPSVVTWVANSPTVFSYDLHTNILPDIGASFRHYIESYFDKFNITGALHECPYDTDEIYKAEEILQALDKTISN